MFVGSLPIPFVADSSSSVHPSVDLEGVLSFLPPAGYPEAMANSKSSILNVSGPFFPHPNGHRGSPAFRFRIRGLLWGQRGRHSQCAIFVLESKSVSGVCHTFLVLGSLTKTGKFALT